MRNVLKTIYKNLPFKADIFKILRIFWRPSPSLYRHLAFKGIFTVKVSGKPLKLNHFGHQVENDIFWSGMPGNFETISMGLWLKLASISTDIIDIGANTGVYALTAKTINPRSKVYAIEPVERVFNKLQQNVNINSFDIHAEQKAASNYDGTATIYDLPTDHIYSVTVNKNLHSDQNDVKEVSISTMRLDTFFEEQGVNNIDLMKIDVETHEAEVLEGMGQYLEKWQPTILIELLNDEVAKNVEQLLKPFDYLYFNIDENKTFYQVDHLTKSDYFNFLICKSAIAKRLNLIA